MSSPLGKSSTIRCCLVRFEPGMAASPFLLVPKFEGWMFDFSSPSANLREDGTDVEIICTDSIGSESLSAGGAKISSSVCFGS